MLTYIYRYTQQDIENDGLYSAKPLGGDVHITAISHSPMVMGVKGLVVGDEVLKVPGSVTVVGISVVEVSVVVVSVVVVGVLVVGVSVVGVSVVKEAMEVKSSMCIHSYWVYNNHTFL